MVRINLDGHQQRDPNLDIHNHQDEREVLETIIRNTYRVLASRGKKGCYIYCCDEELQNYLGRLIPTIEVEVPDDYATYQVGDRPDERGNNAEGNILFIGNNYNRSYHRPECRYAPRNPQKRVEFESVDMARQAGYSPCPTCKP